MKMKMKMKKNKNKKKKNKKKKGKRKKKKKKNSRAENRLERAVTMSLAFFFSIDFGSKISRNRSKYVSR